MTTMNLEGMAALATIPRERFRDAMVWLMFAVSFIVFIEPAPVDFMFLVVVLACWRSGLSRTIGAAPLAVLLIAYNIGGMISVLPVYTEEKTIQFVVTSTYMGVMGIFLAYYVSYDPVRRFEIIRAGFIMGAFLAAITGLLDYMGVAPSVFSHGGILGRATGMFKDPNVFSTYLILPAVMLIQGVMLGTTRRPLLSVLCLLPILAALFLAFSRGAWINFVGATLLMIFLGFIFNVNTSKRLRIGIFVVIATLFFIVAFSILLSIGSVRETFIERFHLLQNYDSGETGRFGNQANAVPLLLSRPLGFGPHQYYNYFQIDPHNTFLNAFASYGWLGGVAYFMLVLSTIGVGMKAIISKTPWQNQAIAVFCPMVTTLLQGVQIDTDHWRHLYWMFGLMWGLFAATLQPTATLEGEAYLAGRQQRQYAEP
jgi:O-antigen ligase